MGAIYELTFFIVVIPKHVTIKNNETYKWSKYFIKNSTQKMRLDSPS